MVEKVETENGYSAEVFLEKRKTAFEEAYQRQWDLMDQARDAPEGAFTPAEKYALGYFGTEEALTTLRGLEKRVQDTVGEPVVAMGSSWLDRHELVYGISTGQLHCEHLPEPSSGDTFYGILKLSLGTTLTVDLSKKIASQEGRRELHDSFNLMLNHQNDFGAGGVDLYARGVTEISRPDHCYSYNTILIGNQEILAWDKINEYAERFALAQAVLDGRHPIGEWPYIDHMFQ